MFEFKYKIHEKLAKLGWCMRVEKGNTCITVDAGSYVETYPEWFVSGVWDGDFTKADFDGCDYLCATAVKISENKVTVYSPTHERQRFCYIQLDDTMYFSNSIPLLLSVSGKRLDVNCDQYEKILCAILEGTKNYSREIPLADNKVMYQIFCADITVDTDLNITYTRKKRHRDFIDFDDYYNTLVVMCERIRDNGCATERKHKYALATTASSGYDSSTCAAIAKSVGCDTLFTFKGGYYDEDSAVDIAKQLGYGTIIERGNLDYREKKGCKDAEFFVCGDHGAYLQFSAFEDDFANHIVFSGTSGSYIWDKDSHVNPDSVRDHYNYYTSNLSFSENALIKGYIFFPLALYASDAAVSIQKITNSPEMSPWTLNTSYDRPICRRILETAGVKRESFGHTKYGGGFSLARNFTLKQMKPKMSKEGYEDFCKWLKIKGNNKWCFCRICHNIQYHLATLPDYIAFVLRKLGVKKAHSDKVIPYPNPGLPAKLIIWAMEKVSSNYSEAMK